MRARRAEKDARISKAAGERRQGIDLQAGGRVGTFSGRSPARQAVDEIRRRRAAGLPPEPLPPPIVTMRAPKIAIAPSRRIIGEVIIGGDIFCVLDCTHTVRAELDQDGMWMTPRRRCDVCLDISTYGAPRPAALACTSCWKAHVDEGIWATRPHTTHRCVDDAAGRGCGAEWTVQEIVRGALCGPCGNAHGKYGCSEREGEMRSLCRAPVAEVTARWPDHEDALAALRGHETYLGAVR